MTTPFIIYALPRSRTAWLANFLTYRGWECYHELAIFMRSMEDVKEFFNNENIGCVETACAQGYRLIRHIVPNIKEVVIFRPVEEVIKAILATEVDIKWDEKILRKNMEYGHRMLKKIAQDENVLIINYNDLNRMDVCAKIFEHCLPYKFDKIWWESIKDKNIQVDMRAFFNYYSLNRQSIEAFKSICKRELIKLCRMGELQNA